VKTAAACFWWTYYWLEGELWLLVSPVLSPNRIYLLNIERLEARLDQAPRAPPSGTPAGQQLRESGYFGKSDYQNKAFLWAAQYQGSIPIGVGSDQSGSTVPGKWRENHFPAKNPLFLKGMHFLSKISFPTKNKWSHVSALWCTHLCLVCWKGIMPLMVLWTRKRL